MKNAIHELSHIVEGHFYIEEKQDLTIVLNTRDLLELLKLTDVHRYDKSSIDYKGDYHLFSSCVVGDTTSLFVEDAHTTDGILKYNETDVLIISNNLPQEIKDHFVKECGYVKIIELNEDSTFEELANKFDG